MRARTRRHPLTSLDVLAVGSVGMLAGAAAARWISPAAGLPAVTIFAGWWMAGLWLVLGELRRWLSDRLDALRGEQ